MVQSGFGRSFLLPGHKRVPMLSASHPIGSAVHAARGACLCLFLLVMAASQAEPRPEAYGSLPDHYANVREALQAGQWSHALGALELLSRQMPSATEEAEFHNLAGFALRQHDPSKLATAIEHYREALRINPAHVQAREYLGQAYLMQGRPDQAQEQLKEIEHHCLGRTCEAWLTLHRAIEAAARSFADAPLSRPAYSIPGN